MSKPAVLFEQVLGGSVSIEALTWLRDAFEQYDRNDGKLPLERCLRLQSRAQRQRERRDYWLRQAYALLDGDAATRRRQLKQNLDDFITRGAWRASASRADAPVEFSPFFRALWNVAQALEGRTTLLCDKQIGRILDIESP